MGVGAARRWEEERMGRGASANDVAWLNAWIWRMDLQDQGAMAEARVERRCRWNGACSTVLLDERIRGAMAEAPSSGGAGGMALDVVLCCRMNGSGGGGLCARRTEVQVDWSGALRL